MHIKKDKNKNKTKGSGLFNKDTRNIYEDIMQQF